MARLDAHQIDHDGIVSGATGDLVAFRDPDNMALEFYTVEPLRHMWSAIPPDPEHDGRHWCIVRAR